MVLFHTVYANFVFAGNCLVVLHLVNLGANSLFVLLLETHDLGGLLLGLLDLFPGLHLFLLEQGDTVSE